MRDAFLATLLPLAKKNKNFVLITGDLGFKVLDPFRHQLPSQFINAGVSEQNMAMMAAGMAQEGKKVFTYSIGNFPTLRCLEMIRNDICAHNLDVKIVCVGGGFSYGALGASHHATEDLSIMRSLSNMTVFCPGSLDEVKILTLEAARMRTPCYLRLDKDGGWTSKVSAPVKIGMPRQYVKGNKLTLLATGGVLSEVEKALCILKKDAIHPSVIGMHTLQPANPASLRKMVKSSKAILTIEENCQRGGLAACLMESLVGGAVGVKRIKHLGIKNAFLHPTGSQKYLRGKCGLLAHQLADAAKKIAGKTPDV